ncbi:MAG: type II secretion system protein [Thermodesulfobacteriota bacterium]
MNKRFHTIIRPRGVRHIKGFTLIEVILFIVLAGILMSTVMAPFLGSVFKMENPGIVAGAVFLAKEKMEQFQPVPYNNIGNEARASLGGNYAAFERQVQMHYVDANMTVSGTDVGYKRVTVTVYHPQLPAAGMSITTLFTDFEE